MVPQAVSMLLVNNRTYGKWFASRSRRLWACRWSDS